MPRKPKPYNFQMYEPDFRRPLRQIKEPYLKVNKIGVYMNRWANELLDPHPARATFYYDKEAKAIKMVREQTENPRHKLPATGSFSVKYRGAAQIGANLNMKVGMPLGVYRYQGEGIFIHEDCL